MFLCYIWTQLNKIVGKCVSGRTAFLMPIIIIIMEIITIIHTTITPTNELSLFLFPHNMILFCRGSKSLAIKTACAQFHCRVATVNSLRVWISVHIKQVFVCRKMPKDREPIPRISGICFFRNFLLYKRNSLTLSSDNINLLKFSAILNLTLSSPLSYIQRRPNLVVLQQFS